MVRPSNMIRSLIKQRYHHVIYTLMEDHNMTSAPFQKPNYIVSPNAGASEAVHYTGWYVTGRYDKPSHYRYNRYEEALRRHVKSGYGMERVAHVDIGCGAGLFSWAFLDWATEKGIGHDRVDLYGYDHCTAMITLASEIRSRIMQVEPIIFNYPSLHDHTIANFLRQLKMTWHPNTDYVITFGHVLAQSYMQSYNSSTSSIVNEFARIIAYIMDIKSAEAKCEIVAVDAKGWTDEFARGWNLLLSHLADKYSIRSTSTSGNPETSVFATIEKRDKSYKSYDCDISYWSEYDREIYWESLESSSSYPPGEHDIYDENNQPYGIFDWSSDIPWYDDDELRW